jgi:hypothetical protein
MRLRRMFAATVVALGALANGFAVDPAAAQNFLGQRTPSIEARRATLPDATVGNRAARGTTADSPGLGNPLWGVPLASLAATRERPIFPPSRRPARVPVAAAPAPLPAEPVPVAKERPRLALLGAIAGEADGEAIFIDETTKAVVRMRTGEGHSGWILRSVKGREATLEKNRETAVVGIVGP